MIELLPVLPEVVLAGSGMLLLLIGAFLPQKISAPIVGTLSLVVLASVAAFMLLCPVDGYVFGSLFVNDAFARFIKAVVLLVSALCLIMSPMGCTCDDRRAEYPVLILFATLGMMLMVSAHNLISLYVGLELQNLSLYILTAFRREDKKASEAGLKYFTLGALSSCILLFGLSLLYGFAGTTGYTELGQFFSHQAFFHPALGAGVAFVLAGLAFKISAAPFHMWAPDVYEGAPVPVTAFLAAAPKLAAMGLIARLFMGPLVTQASIWSPLVVFLCVVSMLWGGFAGLVQGNLKRLMAYSGMINIGTALVGLVCLRADDAGVSGLEGMLLYLALYVVGVVAVFGVMLALEKEGRPVEEIKDFAGLAKTHPAYALALGAALFSLAGIPPFAGFFGKYVVFLAAVKAGYIWLALLGVLASVVAAAYYLHIVKLMYFKPVDGKALDLSPQRVTRFVVVMAALTVTLFVVIPAPLMEAAKAAAESLILS